MLLRYVLFAFGNPTDLVFMYYIGILLHGICYDFFFVTGQLYVDKKAPQEIRASAQGFIAFVTYGLGLLIGAWVAGPVVTKFQQMQGAEIVGHNWQIIWIIPAVMAAVIIVVFTVLFKENES